MKFLKIILFIHLSLLDFGCFSMKIKKSESFLRFNHYKDLNEIEGKNILQIFMKENQTKDLEKELSQNNFDIKKLETDRNYETYEKENLLNLENVMTKLVTINLKNENIIIFN